VAQERYQQTDTQTDHATPCKQIDKFVFSSHIVQWTDMTLEF